jgi:hypothetical protein
MKRTSCHWRVRATALIHAAAKAQGVEPHALAYRGPWSKGAWAVITTFVKNGRLLITVPES